MNVSNSQDCLPSNWFPMMHSPLKGCSTAAMSMSSNLPRIPPIPVGRKPRGVNRSFQSLITIITYGFSKESDPTDSTCTSSPGDADVVFDHLGRKPPPVEL